MFKKILKRKALILLVSVALVALFLRADNLKTYPRLGSTFDEFAWTWVGVSLIQEQMPSSWSPHEPYVGHRVHKVYLDADFWIVKPYLEHPPFFGIVAGSFALLNGASGMFDVTLDTIRPLALILGVLSVVILFFLVKELYGDKIALLASLIYAIIPTVVIGSRLVQNENFFIPLFLLSLYFIVRFIKSKEVKYRNIAAIICGLLVLSKIPWIAGAVAIIAILFYVKKYKDAGKFLLIVIPFFIFYIIYGIYFNQEIFFNLWGIQLQRYDLTFNSVFALFTEPFLTDRYFIDGWIYFGWFAFILVLIKNLKENYVLVLGLLAYLGIFIFAIPNEAGHGWYRYPFYPFLAISIALFIKEYFNKNLILSFLFILLIGLSLLELTWTTKFGFSFVVFRGFLILSATSLLPLFFKSQKIKKYSFAMNNLMLIFIFMLSFSTVIFYIDQ